MTFVNKAVGFIQDVGGEIGSTIGFGKPTADISTVDIESINLTKADILVDILIKNPNPIPIPSMDISYLVESSGRNLVAGFIPQIGMVHAHEEKIVKIPVSLIYEDIKNTYNDIEPGTILPYCAKIDLIVDMPVLGKLTLPLEITGEVPFPYRPEISIKKIHFDRFSFEETVAVLRLKLENKNDFDLGLNVLEYEVWLVDFFIGGAELSKSAKIDRKGFGFIDVPISFRPKDFGFALWDMIRGRGTGYTIRGNIDVATPFGSMKLPIIKEGGTTRIKQADDSDSDIDSEVEGEATIL